MTERRNGFVPKSKAEYRRMQRLRGMTFRVAVVVQGDKDGDNDTDPTMVKPERPQVTLSFKGSQRALLQVVFDRLRGVLMQEYEIRPVILPEMVNGTQTSWYDVVCFEPDVQLASPQEWCPLIARMMNRCIRCEMTVCRNYEQFLNL